MAISDLSGTIWVLNNTISLDYDSYNINFTSNNTQYSSFEIRYGNSSVSWIIYGNDTVCDIYNNSRVTSFYNDAYKIISITGGTDRSNATLIQWLTDNATQVAVSDLSGTTWVFNNNNLSLYTDTFSINFTSNNNQYTSISFNESSQGGGGTTIDYNNVNVFSGFDGEGDWEDQAYRTIEITGGTDAINADLIVLITDNATQVVAPTAVFDLDTLELPAGTYTITAKAEGSGFQDSVASNSVSFTVAPSEYTIRIIGYNSYNSGEYCVNNGTWTDCPTTETTLTNVWKLEIQRNTGEVDTYYIYDSNNVLIHSGEFDPGVSVDVTQYLQNNCLVKVWED